MISLTFETLDS